MSDTQRTNHTEETFNLQTQLPGPDRKRTPRAYRYRLMYRNPDPNAVGCLLTWEVCGGRVPYQIAIEREESGAVRSHCSCADAVFRRQDEGHVCKHVLGILQLGRQTWEAIGPEARACA